MRVFFLRYQISHSAEIPNLFVWEVSYDNKSFRRLIIPNIKVGFIVQMFLTYVHSFRLTCPQIILKYD